MAALALFNFNNTYGKWTKYISESAKSIVLQL